MSKMSGKVSLLRCFTPFSDLCKKGNFCSNLKTLGEIEGSFLVKNKNNRWISVACYFN